MSFRQDQPTFAGLEIGPDLQSRYDTAKYHTALRKARNVIGRPGGGFQSRPGLRWVGEVYDSERLAVLLPFQFSLSQAYVLEFGHLIMRVISDGGYVLRPEIVVTGISNDNGATVTAPGHGYSVGDDVYFSGIEGMTEINGLLGRILSITDANNFVTDIDTTLFSVFTGSSGGVPGAIAGGTEGDPPAGPPEVVPPFVDIETPPPTYEWNFPGYQFI